MARLLAILAFLVAATSAVGTPIRLKDLVEFDGVRANELVGYGLVVHHCRFRRNTAKISKRPDSVLGRSMANCGRRLRAQSATTNNLNLLDELVPVAGRRETNKAVISI